MDARTGLPVVGMVGAGQLARMTHQAAIPLGQSLRILADSADDGAALVAADVVVGDYRSLADLRAFAAGCDVVTWDHEHVPNEHIAALAAEGVAVQPGADALRFAQDKAAMRERLTELGVPCPRWARIGSAADLDAFAAQVGWPLVLKAATGGYDGKGVWVVSNALDAAAVVASGVSLIAEEKVAIARELAADVARSPWGQGARLAGRRDRAAGRDLRGGHRAGAVAVGGPRRRGAGARAAHRRRNSASPACWPSSCSRRPTGGCW